MGERGSDVYSSAALIAQAAGETDVDVNITGKVTIVTGAARGIGAALAQRFAAEGARVAILDRDQAGVQRVADELKKAGADVLALECDVTSQAAVETAVASVVSRFGTVDVLINNAGVAPGGTVAQMDLAQWDETYAVNVRGLMLCCRAVVPHMQKQKSGRILNASSFAAIIPSYAFAAYASSKAAVVSFTRVLAAELGPWNITVNAYAPGMVPTQMNKFAEAPPERQKALLDTLTIRRWESPDDLGPLLVFLASDLAAYITGALIDVSGGKFSVQFPQASYAAANV
jgi:3-oxoacyl-[acyl-carrier protein] reductase